MSSSLYGMRGLGLSIFDVGNKIIIPDRHAFNFIKFSYTDKFNKNTFVEQFFFLILNVEL